MSKSSMTIEELGEPDWVRTHPGLLLKEEFMDPLGLSCHALSLALRVPANRILDITKGQRGITADTALRLARYFGTSAQFWLNAQQAHDLSAARQELGAQIERDVNPHVAA